MTDTKKEAPARIWLQDGDEDEGTMHERPDYDGVTWCADQINNDDTEYIRLDLHESALQQAEKDKLDARRYRWLRSDRHTLMGCAFSSNEELDAAIDAALEADK